jgi:hypothetical protein
MGRGLGFSSLHRLQRYTRQEDSWCLGALVVIPFLFKGKGA